MQLSDSYFLQSWAMYSKVSAVCTVRFISAADPTQDYFHRLVTTRLIQFNERKPPRPVVLKSEADARRFITGYCHVPQQFGPTQFDLNCFVNKAWVELAHREDILCL